MEDRTPRVGFTVHTIHLMRCVAGIIVDIDLEDGVVIQEFPPDGELPLPGAQPYNSLHSARPTSGWHWMEEHE